MFLNIHLLRVFFFFFSVKILQFEMGNFLRGFIHSIGYCDGAKHVYIYVGVYKYTHICV